MKQAESAITRYWLRDDGIVIARSINTDVERTAKATRETLVVLGQLVGTKPRPGLWDARGLSKTSPKGWVVLVQMLANFAIALAILVDDDLEAALGTFPERMDSFLFPVRLFRDEDEAIEWLQGFLD
jgi:hypothetical protein